MERRRVAEIKKRFEDSERAKTKLTTVQNRTSGQLTNNSSTSCCEGRRWNLPRKPHQLELQRLTTNGGSVNGTTTPVIKSPQLLEDHSGGKPIVKRTPAFRSSRNELASVSKAITDKAQSKRIVPPATPSLPIGPAPQKPPRTFAHRVTDGVNSSNINDTSLPCVETSKLARFKRSRTEPLLMLEKIESALKNHQNSSKGLHRTAQTPLINVKSTPNAVLSLGVSLTPQSNTQVSLGTFQSLPNTPRTFGSSQSSHRSPSSPPGTSHSASRTVLMYCKTSQSPPGLNKTKFPKARNDYDEPFEDVVQPKRRTLTPPLTTPEPLYSVPCLAKAKSASPPASQPPKSLYYMSTPIVVRPGKTNVNSPELTDSDECMRKMQTLAVDTTSGRQDPDSDVESIKEIKQEVVEERKIYAKRVSSMRNPLEAYHEVRTQRLMDVLLLIGIDSDDSGKVPYIKSKYPYNAGIPENLGSFVFPDAADWPPLEPHTQLATNHNNYTIALTSAKYERTYAYCRRLQPEGSSVCLPLAYAILTPHKASNFYYKILEEIENNHGLPEQQFKEFVRDLYNTDFPPDENQSIRVGTLALNRMKDSRKEGNEISQLLKAVGVQIFLRLLSSLLSEKKIIFLSSNISLLSDSVEGLLKSLYPFEWPHAVVTVIPPQLYEILQLPAPYVAGIMKNDNISDTLFKNIEHVLVVDVDKGQIVTNTEPRSDPVIPEKLVKALSVNLYLTPVNGTDIGPSEALIRLFVQLVGHYRNHLVTLLDSCLNHRRTFQKESFIKAPTNKGVRQFLEWFTDTFIFQVFIHEKLERGIVQRSLLFDERCAEYIEENACKKSTSLNKAVKNLGDRFKDWAS